MGRPPALNLALMLVERPAGVRHLGRSPLPDGVTLLLRVAAGEPDAVRSAQAMTGRSQAALQTAAGFFIEQVLFDAQADSYRVLGASPGAPRSALRQHMALLIRWLHPDGQEQRSPHSDVDRGIFIHRVTQAWETLKNDERRAVYDRSLAEKAEGRIVRQAQGGRIQDKRRRAERKAAAPGGGWRGARPASRRLIMYEIKRETLLSRLFSFLWTRA
jgi:DnaJ domain